MRKHKVVHNAYEPDEVDTEIDELNNEIVRLELKNRKMYDVLADYDNPNNVLGSWDERRTNLLAELLNWKKL